MTLNGDSTVLRKSLDLNAVRAFELENPMFKGFGEYLQRQGKLEPTTV